MSPNTATKDVAQEEEDQRVAFLGQDKLDYVSTCQQHRKVPEKHCNNEIKTSKYTVMPFSLNFIIWKNLAEQFRRAANIYFLFIAILQMIPGVSPTGRFTTIIPLSLVMTLSLLKDAYEDFRRHRQDAELNNTKATVFRDGQWHDTTWRDIAVGDILKLQKGDAFPADMLILWSSEPEGLCYIETSSLDGETNLKIRKSCSQTYSTLNPEACGSLSCTLRYEMPNNRLYNFDGTLALRGEPVVPLNNDNIFLRGSALRNTDVAYGAVLFTGADTKLMKNSSATRHKMSNVDHITNRQILYIFLLQLGVCLISAIGLGFFTNEFTEHWYLAAADEKPVLVALLGILTFLILFNNLIPISLYVSMEMVKLFQAAMINTDVDMYHTETDTPAAARTSSLNEELGQVKYIFSDKTGTLTCNMMDFMQFSCIDERGKAACYGTGTTEIARAAAAREGRVLKDDRPSDFVGEDGFCFYDERVTNNRWTTQPNAAQIEEFLRHLAVCHTVVAEYNDAGGPAVYQAASPDEGCLVKGARALGVVFESRTENTVTINVRGARFVYEILNIIEFDSTRKRMSVVVRDPDGKLQVLCKGADSVVFERLTRQDDTADTLDRTLEMLTEFAEAGLRTLVIAKADLDPLTYTEWAVRYEAAGCALTDRAEKLAAIGEEIERDLTLVGTTAIEDKLQSKVPETVELLLAAGIKVWVLTGDKQETAINIGYACALLNNDMSMWTFDDVTADTVLEAVDGALVEAKENAASDLPSDMALVIQGGLLEAVLTDKRLSLTFLELACMCKAVVCCRVSPLQKAQVVSLVRDNIADTITLAIGDGANDVSMIQAASVGIGISGLEGLQAARASDYSIAQFRFLQRLLLVHGRWNYRRISRLILYSFYKNICLYLTQFWFCTLNGFSGQSLYDPWSLSVYNVLFTSLPIMVLAILDRDVEPRRSLSPNQFPDLFRDGLTNRLFNTRNFWVYVANAIFHSAVCFYIPVFVYAEVLDREDGLDDGISSLGVLCYSAVVATVTAKVGLETLSWTVVHAFFTAGSFLLWFVFVFAWSSLYDVINWSDLSLWYGTGVSVVPELPFWLTLVLVTFIAVLRDFLFKVYRRNFNPELSHVIQVFEGTRDDFCRADVQLVHSHLLGRLESTAPTKGGHISKAPSLAVRTGFAFSQEEGQADITRILGRALSTVGIKRRTQSSTQ